MSSKNFELIKEITELSAQRMAEVVPASVLATHLMQLFMASILYIRVLKEKKVEVDPKFLAYVRSVARAVPMGEDILNGIWEKDKDDYAGL